MLIRFPTGLAIISIGGIAFSPFCANYTIFTALPKLSGRLSAFLPNPLAERRQDLLSQRRVEIEQRFARETVLAYEPNLLDSHGGRHVRVRTPKKVFQHLMYGVLVIAVEQTMRILC